MHRQTSKLLQLGMGGHLGLGYEPNIPQRKVQMQEEMPTVAGMKRRLDFYDYEHVHPAKQLGYFIIRHLRKIPKEWQNYYHSLYRSEFAATRGVNKNWDQFCYVHDGYRKAKWVLAKYGQVPTPGSIPEPYFSQWANATAEERAWAYRRSFHLKELQALQRETCDAFGSIARDRSSTVMSHLDSTSSDPARVQTGNNVHAEDMPAPRERMIRDDVEMSEVYMMTIQDDKQWNPLLKKESVGEAEFWGFEDEDDEDDLSPSAASARRRRDKREEEKRVQNNKQRNSKHTLGDSERSASSEFHPSRRRPGGEVDGGGFVKVGGDNEDDDLLSRTGGDLSKEELMKQEIPLRPTGGRVPSKRNFG